MSQVIQNRRLATYAVIINDGHVLLSKLNRGQNIGKWNLPGGGVEHGEAPLQALSREIQEEAGLSFSETPQILTALSFHQQFPMPTGEIEDFHMIGIIYLIQASSRPTPKPGGDGESSLGCEWFRIQDLKPDQIVSFVSDSLKLI